MSSESAEKNSTSQNDIQQHITIDFHTKRLLEKLLQRQYVHRRERHHLGLDNLAILAASGAIDVPPELLRKMPIEHVICIYLGTPMVSVRSYIERHLMPKEYISMRKNQNSRRQYSFPDNCIDPNRLSDGDVEYFGLSIS